MSHSNNLITWLEVPPNVLAYLDDNTSSIITKEGARSLRLEDLIQSLPICGIDSYGNGFDKYIVISKLRNWN